MKLGDITAKVVADTKGFVASMNGVTKTISGTTSKSAKVIKGIGTAFSKVGKVAVGVGKVALGAITTMSVAIGALVATSLKNVAEYEQLAGGVKKLFEDSSGEVMMNAERAFKTAGLSANKYMEIVTGFSASLLQSLGGDTKEATELSDMAIKDMSDNANTYGTDISMIQNAYQGFAKQNFMMLDNLKLGYGGTATEMARLINDTGVMGKSFTATAENVKGIGFDKYIEAIHAVQVETKITGTTAKEASETITGSVNSAKASWSNLLTAFASDDLDTMSNALEGFASSIGDVFKNVMKVIPNILVGIGEVVKEIFSSIDLSEMISMIMDQIPMILDLAVQIIQSLVSGLQDNLPMIVGSAILIIDTLINALVELVPLILKIGLDLLVALIKGIIKSIPDLIPVVLDAVMTIINTVVENLPMILEAGIEILLAVIEGITEIIPDLIPTIIDAVLLIVKTLIDNLPLIFELGIEIIIAIIEGLVEAIPDLIDYIPTIIESIITAIIPLMPLILYAGIRILIELAKGLIVAIPKLVAKIPQIIDAIGKSLGEGVISMREQGRDLVAGIWEGIKNSATWIKDKLRGWVGEVTASVKKFFGISSPSTVMEDEVGMNIGAGIANGIRNSVGLVEDAMSGIDSAVTTAISPMISPNINASAMGMGGSGGGINLSINMSGANISSPEVAQEYAESIGDAIVGKLRTNRRSYV